MHHTPIFMELETTILISNIAIIIFSVVGISLCIMLVFSAIELRYMTKEYNKERMKLIQYIKYKIENDGQTKSINGTVKEISEFLKNRTIF